MESASSDNVSYWVASTQAEPYPALEGTIEVDVAIVGAGIVGITTGLLLQRAGKRSRSSRWTGLFRECRDLRPPK